jgi:hypothetical protein
MDHYYHDHHCHDDHGPGLLHILFWLLLALGAIFLIIWGLKGIVEMCRKARLEGAGDRARRLPERLGWEPTFPSELFELRGPAIAPSAVGAAVTCAAPPRRPL